VAVGKLLFVFFWIIKIPLISNFFSSSASASLPRIELAEKLALSTLSFLAPIRSAAMPPVHGEQQKGQMEKVLILAYLFFLIVFAFIFFLHIQ
jgi:hypothetical protein